MQSRRIPALLAPLLAAGSAAAEQTAVPAVSGASLVQGLLGVVFVVGLLLVAAWALRRMTVGGRLGGTGGMRIVAGLSVGPRERILLLEIGDTWIVVGVSASQMRTLHTMTKGELPLEGGNAGADGPFAAWLRRASERGRNGA